MTDSIILHWFRNDLRLSDNPALFHNQHDGKTLAIYILDEANAGQAAMGGASRWWLHESLNALNQNINDSLNCYIGDAQSVFESLLSRFPIQKITWNRCYTPWQIQRDTQLKQFFKSRGVAVESYNSALLWEPWIIAKKDGTPYSVFTPYYRNGCLNSTPPRQPLAEPTVNWLRDEDAQSIDTLNLLPDIAWHEQLAPHWRIGEHGAQNALAHFIDNGLAHYRDGRDFPAQPHTSRLSPHLHFGEISPNQIWHSVRTVADDKHSDMFCSELGWREFSYYLLYHHPHLPTDNLQRKFDAFPWQTDMRALRAWQKGKTGIPIVDAGMRELWQTGSMHNRVRMIVGSFLVKNLRIHWHHGAEWFWDCLVDADLASNSASWQWIAGCGADAAPYFRIFNPVTQSEKFDAEGEYIRRYVPELTHLPNKYLFAPWTAPTSVLLTAGVTLGQSYPAPLVDLKVSRQVALDAFASLKTAQP